MHPDFGGDAKRVLKAVSRSLAIIEFEPNGKIIVANENFGRLLGFEPTEIKGKPHSLFVDPATANSPDYKSFWAKLGVGNSKTANTSLSARTEAKFGFAPSTVPSSARQGKRSKSSRSLPMSQPPNCRPPRTPQSSKRFRGYRPSSNSLSTGIVAGNENFLKLSGYPLEKLKGQHHRKFVDPGLRAVARVPGVLAQTEKRRTY